jgi:hypothetical protein
MKVLSSSVHALKSFPERDGPERSSHELSSILLIASALIFISYALPFAAFAADWDIYAIVESFTWREFASNISRLVKETGPLYGVGYRWWLRDINNNDSAPGNLERWRSFYARAGARGDYIFPGGQRIFTEAGALLPISNRNTADLSIAGPGNPTLKPGRRASLFAEAGLRISKFEAGVFYEGVRFPRSPAVDVGGGVSVVQPESKADIVGVKIGIVF